VRVLAVLDGAEQGCILSHIRPNPLS
jgi:hypothetical protein